MARLNFLDATIRKIKEKNIVFDQMGKIIKRYQLKNFVTPSFLLLRKYYRAPVPESFIKLIKPDNPLTRQLINRLTTINIFDDESRVQAGINRFKNLFFLSP